MTFRFEKATRQHHEIIFSWLAEPHMIEFWDNSQEHKDDIVVFMNGRQEPSNYFNGIFTYWVGYTEDTPFCFILTANEVPTDSLPALWNQHLSKTGHTYSLDFGIGDPNFIGKGLAAPALVAFVDFFRESVDSKADTFYIDPDNDNPRAQHVYEKAGFIRVGEYDKKLHYWEFSGDKTFLMIKRFDT